jgi:putative CocE/NonD family hydrolase
VSLASRALGLLYRLGPRTHGVDVVRDIPVPMTDGVTLLADRYVPIRREGGEHHAPTILVRSPYGRSQLVGLLYGRLLAERGLSVLVQSCRGTFGSGGTFDPLRNERADGLATVAWLRSQPWFPGELGMIGPSYLGFAQWAIAAEVPELRAMSVQVSTSDMRSAIHAGGSFWLKTALTWAYLVSEQERSLLSLLLAPFRAPARLRAVDRHSPLVTIDEALLDRRAPFLRDWLEHFPSDAFWSPVDFSAGVERVSAAVHLTGGWYDIFLPETLADYARLRRGGHTPHLTIGPWAHLSPDLTPWSLREALAWFRAHLGHEERPGQGRQDEAPVRIFVMGTGRWRTLPEWPPGADEQRWHLAAGGALTTDAPTDAAADTYRYDPADPTPSIGGSSLSIDAGAKDNRRLEARRDVLVYTSQPLTAGLTVIGPVRAELFVASSASHADLFVRLCDVAPSGRSTNVTDALKRLTGVDLAGTNGPVTVELWPTAHAFRRGHRLRVLVSSGAHPRYARNLGTGEPLATGTTFAAAEQTVFHDPARPSAIVLPVVAAVDEP